MNRSEDHVTSYLFAELGTSGSVDGSRRLVSKYLRSFPVIFRMMYCVQVHRLTTITVKGRFQQKQIENVLRRCKLIIRV